ncbi:MAG: DEAD/DEAH box helicase [bacterium]
MNFEELNLISPLLKAVKAEGYETPTPIQEQAIPHVLAGKDILGCAQTGTGKTAAFALPILQKLCEKQSPIGRPIRALTLTPTRELASQIGDSFATYGKNTGLRHLVIFGGVNQRPQAAALHRGVDILIATPGRLLDLTYQGLINYYALEVFVLDEADRMLDMGFIHDVRKIVDLLPEKRQTLFFSATMPNEIKKFADNILHDAVQVAVAPPCSTVDLIDQSVFFVERMDKPNLLAHLMKDPKFNRVLIFTRTKHGADKVASNLGRNNIRAEAIHGNKAQNARERALDMFKQGRIRALVATDIASRGIDVENISHVINYDLPNESESYVHRIGRTGRAGAAGAAIAFCDSTERPFLVDIERLIKKRIPHAIANPFRSHISPPSPTDLEPRRQTHGNFNSGYRPVLSPAERSGGSRRGGGSGFKGDGYNKQRSSSRPVNRGMKSK